MENMEHKSIDELEAGVDRLLAAYNRVKGENLLLRQQLAELDKRHNLFKDRLDSLLAKLDGIDAL
jgi:FtsZ-binding cell division protein ZapB